MASETLGADEPPRTRHRWDENSKVYTRKFYRHNKTNHKNLEPSATTTINSAAVLCNTGEINKKSNSNCSNDGGNSSLKDDNVINSNFVNGTAANNNSSYKDDSKNNESHDKENEDIGQKLSTSPPRTSASPRKLVEEANVSQPQEDSLRLGNASGDSPQPQLDSSRLEAISGDLAQPQQECPGLEAASVDSPQHQQDSLRLGVASGDSPQHQQDSLRLEPASGDLLEHQQDSLRLEAASGDLPPPQQDSLRLRAASGDSPQHQQDSLRVRAASRDSPQHQQGSLRLRAPSGDSAQHHQDSLRLRAASGDSLQPKQAAPRLVLTVSGGSSSLNRVEAPVPNGHDENLANGSASRMMVTQVDDRLNISVSAARSREEVRDLKRKLVDELDQVRKMAKKLEAKEIQVSGYSSIGVERTAPVVERLQYPANNGGNEKELSSGGMRMNSETHSAGYNEPRPFRRLSVSVMDNNHHGVIGEVVEKEKRTPKANQYYRNSEFLLGKDRLPPESNRKAKSAGGKKHSGGEFDFGFRIDKKIFSKCSSLLQKIMNHKHGWVFNQPVDVKRLGLHDYFDIIKHPMDLGTVKARLTKNWYKTPREFAEDVRLTFHNALTYNPPGQDVHIMAQELLRMFEEKWPAIETEFDRKLRYEMIRDLGVPTPTSRKTYAPAHVSVPMLAPPPLLHPPPSFQDMRNLERSQSMPVRPESRPKPAYSVGRKPVPKKPKAKDPHKRDMTFEEKQKLSTHLQSLPTEKLDAIVQIIKKRNSALSQHDDEIEVDIDSVDAETLWELDRFVTNYKKSLSKHKKKAELAQARAAAAAAAAAQAAQETTPTPANIEPPTETRATDEGNVPPSQGNVPPSPRAHQGERHSDNNSGSSSSSSSSSSGSSSSDSDSDSSSGSDSEGGH